MNLEEMNEEEKAEVLETFNSWVKEQGYKSPEEVEGLAKKKDELLGKVSKLNKERVSEDKREILNMLDELGVQSAEDIKSLFEKKSGDKKDDRELKKYEKQLQELQERYDSEHKTRLNMAKENAIVKALKEAGVKDSAFDMAYAYFDRQAEVEETDNGVSVIAKDKDGLGPSIDNYIKEWAKGDAAKDYIQKPMNVGAGVSGSGDVKSKMVFTREELSDPKVARQVMERKRAGEDIKIEN